MASQLHDKLREPFSVQGSAPPPDTGVVDLEDLPPVTGRHRNRALAAERRRHAVEMALTGYTYQAIADQLGYASRGPCTGS